MKFKNFRAIINRITGMFRRLLEPLVMRGGKYLKILLGYLQTSETIFLLLFASIIGIGTGFAAILFRWMIGFFQNLFFDQGQHLLSFMGSYYVIIVPAAGGIVVGLLIHFFGGETKGHGVPEVMLAVTTAGGKIRPRVAALKALVSSICTGWNGCCFCSRRSGSYIGNTFIV